MAPPQKSILLHSAMLFAVQSSEGPRKVLDPEKLARGGCRAGNTVSCTLGGLQGFPFHSISAWIACRFYSFREPMPRMEILYASERGVRGRKSQRDRPFLCSERAYSKSNPHPACLVQRTFRLLRAPGVGSPGHRQAPQGGSKGVRGPVGESGGPCIFGSVGGGPRVNL